MSNELVLLEVSEKNYPKIYCAGGLDAFYEKSKAEVDGEVPDLSTRKGRDRIATLAADVSRSKVAVETPGRAYNKFLKAQPKLIDKELREFCDKMDKLRDDTRAPLTAWEAIDKAEKAQVIDTNSFLAEYELQHEDGLRDNELINLKRQQAEADRQAEIKEAAEKAASEAKLKAEQEAAEKIAKAEREKIESEQRYAKAKQDIIDAKIKADQSERDRIAAEEANKENVRIDYHKRMIQHIVDCGNGVIGGSLQSFGILFRELESKIVIDESFEEFRQEAESARNKAMQKLKDCQERQAKANEEVEAKIRHDNEIAAENARLDEVQRQKDLSDQKKREQAAREADLDNRAAKYNAAKDAIIALGFQEAGAKALVKAIAKGQIPNVTISY